MSCEGALSASFFSSSSNRDPTCSFSPSPALSATLHHFLLQHRSAYPCLRLQTLPILHQNPAISSIPDRLHTLPPQTASRVFGSHPTTLRQWLGFLKVEQPDSDRFAGRVRKNKRAQQSSVGLHSSSRLGKDRAQSSK